MDQAEVPEEPACRVAVVGVDTDRHEDLPPRAAELLAAADAVAGGRRLLALWRQWHPQRAQGCEQIEIGAELPSSLQRVWGLHRSKRRVCILASGDPGFFGVLRAALRVLDRRSLEVIPARSAVSVAFARLGVPWDDAAVVSVHGRPLAEAVGAIRTARKVAVLTSPDCPPQRLAAALVDAGASTDLAAVCSHLGSSRESVTELPLDRIAQGHFDPLSVVVLLGPAGLPLVGWSPGTDPVAEAGPAPPKQLAWGLPDTAFAHRAGMITKAEVRAVVLSKLALPRVGILWDVGAASGSVALEAALLCPGLTVFAIEQAEEEAARISANARSLGARVHVVTGHAPEAMAHLPAPDSAFVGGGGLSVLRATLDRLRPGGRVVATFAALERAAAGAGLLGNLAQVVVNPAERLADGAWRLSARNPVFVAWGPSE